MQFRFMYFVLSFGPQLRHTGNTDISMQNMGIPCTDMVSKRSSILFILILVEFIFSVPVIYL